MLEYEYLQCNLTLRKERGKNTAFFAFADTVVAKAYGRDNECHGWLVGASGTALKGACSAD